MRLLAISDLHVGHPANREAVAALPEHPGDWLIVAGDISESEADLVATLRLLGRRFEQLFWVPGNHELWTRPDEPAGLRGEARYQRFVAICRDLGVLTPEDPWVPWPGVGPPTLIAPVFCGYDYSFGPDGLSPAEVVAWAKAGGIYARDEALLHPDPWESRVAWCHDRVAKTERRLAAVPEGHHVVLVNHWPLRRDLVRLVRVPRYAPWCGTRLTEDWHRRYPISVVVSGHLHMPATDWRDGVRFEEVSLGYPRERDLTRPVASRLREILPGGLPTPPSGHGGPVWQR